MASTEASTEEAVVDTAVVHLEEVPSLDHPYPNHCHHLVKPSHLHLQVACSHHLPVEDHNRPDELDHFGGTISMFTGGSTVVLLMAPLVSVEKAMLFHLFT